MRPGSRWRTRRRRSCRSRTSPRTARLPRGRSPQPGRSARCRRGRSFPPTRPATGAGSRDPRGQQRHLPQPLHRAARTIPWGRRRPEPRQRAAGRAGLGRAAAVAAGCFPRWPFRQCGTPAPAPATRHGDLVAVGQPQAAPRPLEARSSRSGRRIGVTEQRVLKGRPTGYHTVRGQLTRETWAGAGVPGCCPALARCS